jgi:hypothetical protein
MDINDQQKYLISRRNYRHYQVFKRLLSPDHHVEVQQHGSGEKGKWEGKRKARGKEKNEREREGLDREKIDLKRREDEKKVKNTCTFGKMVFNRFSFRLHSEYFKAKIKNRCINCVILSHR